MDFIRKFILAFFNTLCAVFLMVPLSYSDDITGEKLFNRNCAACHKKTAPNLNGTVLKYDVFASVVLNGRPGTMMGAFNSKFNHTDIKNINEFLRNN